MRRIVQAYAAFQQALHAGCAQERDPTAIDHVFIDLALAPSESGGVRLGWCDLRRNRRRAVEPLQPQQVAAVVHDGDADGPLILQGFGLGGSGNGLHVGEFQGVLGLHGG